MGRHGEVHHSDRSAWLRATVLGANDGLLSTGALLLGVISAGAGRPAVLTAGVAGIAAGAASMAMG
ncbi:MAG: VIT1/CCC1 transporter family protein, partial [Microthrixaceae bacterium]